MILLVGPNPAIDRSAVVERLADDRVLRPTSVTVQAGGKALNVARAARSLGANVMTTGICGGHAGRWLVDAAQREGLNPRFVQVDQETRTTYVVVDGRGRSISVYEPSAITEGAAFEALLALVERELLPVVDQLVVAGSVPMGLGPETMGQLVEAGHAVGRSVLLDTSGRALVVGLSARPDTAKVSLSEVIEAGLVRSGASIEDAASALVGAGAGIGIVTDGPRGSAASDGRDRWRVAAPRIDAVDPIGSGDAFTAGLVVGASAGRPLEDRLAWATAAGAANAITVGAGRLDPEIHAALLADIRVERLGGRRG